MLGTEYNWLISHSRPAHGAPQVRVASSGLLTLAVAVFCFLAVALRAEPAAPVVDETAWAITGMDGIIEGIALHPTTNEAFFSDVHNRCIWYRDTSGASAVMKKFSADSDGLLGVFALKFDAAGRTLWATSSALPEMKGYTESDKGRGLLVAYDLASRQLRQTYELPYDGRAHVIGDFIVAPDGTLYLTDSLSPVIWRLRIAGNKLERWLENENFKSLQGITLSADARSLYVADYSKGIWRIDVTTRTPFLLPAPPQTNLKGIDGLYAIPGGIAAVQNGTRTQRILKLTLAPGGAITSSAVWREGHPAMTDLSLGQVVNGRLHFIANSGWALYANPAAIVAPRTVTILDTPTH